jgi:flagellar P-ring protein precursor FlgI
LGPFNRKGNRISITVSASGNTTSLQGGTLLMTELKGADGTTYAVAQGQVTIGGFAAAGENASVSKNHPTVGLIRNGATVEREELATFVENGTISLNLRNADFTTADRMSKKINTVYPNSTVVEDGGTVKIEVPKKLSKAEIARFIDVVGALEIEVDYPAVVVINERTGAIVVGENVKISSVAIALGSLTIVKSEKEYVSQPNEFASGKTEKVNRTEMNVKEGEGSLKYIPRQVSVAELAKALNSMGLSARDLITIFEMLHESGALQAQIKTM